MRSMKSGAKVRRIHLVDNQSNNSTLIGIVSSEPDYKISLAINRKLGIALKHDHPLTISTKENESLIFSRFSDPGASHDQGLDLTSNRAGKDFLVKKLRNIDYILQVHNPGNEASIRKIISSLKEIEGVTAVLIIDRTAIKDKNLEYIIQ